MLINSFPQPGELTLKSHEESGGLLTTWIVDAALVLGFVWLFHDFGRHIERDEYVAWLIFAIAAAVVGYRVVRCVRKTLEWRRFGSIVLRLEAPVKTGGKLRGRITLPLAARSTSTLTATLACIARERRQRPTDDDPQYQESVAWSADASVPILWSASEGVARIDFEVPVYWPATDNTERNAMELNRAYHRWELRIRAVIPGIGLDRSFRLHVARGAAPPPAGPVELAPRGPRMLQ